MRTWLASGLGVGTSFTSHLALTAGTTAAFILSDSFLWTESCASTAVDWMLTPRAGSHRRHARAGNAASQSSGKPTLRPTGCKVGDTGSILAGGPFPGEADLTDRILS